MRFGIARALMAGAIALTMATASEAASLTFSLTGLFDIDLGGTIFNNIDLTLTGTGSSSPGTTATNGDPIITFSSFDAIVPGFGTFPVPSSIVFYYDPSGSGEGGFIDTATGDKVLILQSPAFTGYDGQSNLTASGLSFTSAQGFDTPFGTAAVLTASDLDLQAVLAAPEAATWAMFIGGFGFVGGAMRRRQRTTVRFA